MAGKADVINAIAEQAGISKKEAGAAFDAFVGYITEACQGDVRCAIPGLGSFGVTHRKAREGRNPRTNEKIKTETWDPEPCVVIQIIAMRDGSW